MQRENLRFSKAKIANFYNCFGWVAQLVEQRTENPCVGGSIPPPATIPYCGCSNGLGDFWVKTDTKTDTKFPAP